MRESGLWHCVTMTLLALSLAFPPGVHAASQDGATGMPTPPPPPEAVSPEPIKGVQPAPGSLQQDIPDWQTRWELARLLSYAKRYEESLVEYRKVAQEKPDLWEAKIEMAQVLFWSGRQSEASRILEGIPIEHTDERGKLLMADLYVAQKLLSKAEPIYRAYLDSHPQDYEVRVKLADVLGWSKRYEEALAQYRTLLGARPDDVQIRRKYAYVLIWAGKQTEAAEELKKTLK